jgi:hypothetical protein
LVPAETPGLRTFIYLQDPGHGWLIVTRDDRAGAGMSAASISSCSYVSGENFALEEDCDMPSFLKRLDERDVPYRLREQHCNGDAYVGRWASNPGLDLAETDTSYRRRFDASASSSATERHNFAAGCRGTANIPEAPTPGR